MIIFLLPKAELPYIAAGIIREMQEDHMGFDELEWVRDVIDQWLTANGSTLALVVVLLFALGSLVFGN